MFKHKTVLDWISLIIVIVGAVNWGLVGTLNYDLISYLFGRWYWVSHTIYTLVGFAGLYLIYAIARPSETEQTYGAPEPPQPPVA